MAIYVCRLSSLSFSHDASALPQVSHSSIGPGRLAAHPPCSLTYPGAEEEVQGIKQKATTLAISVERVSNQPHTTYLQVIRLVNGINFPAINQHLTPRYFLE